LVTIHREMGLDHREFFRTLPAALEGSMFRVSGARIEVSAGWCQLRITLAPPAERRIGLLRLPVTRVTFEFTGGSEGKIEDFMRRFDRHYQRGGG
jgi:hypothetical protein